MSESEMVYGFRPRPTKRRKPQNLKAKPCEFCGAKANVERRLDYQRGPRWFCKVDTLEQLKRCLRAGLDAMRQVID